MAAKIAIGAIVKKPVVDEKDQIVVGRLESYDRRFARGDDAQTATVRDGHVSLEDDAGGHPLVDQLERSWTFRTRALGILVIWALVLLVAIEGIIQFSALTYAGTMASLKLVEDNYRRSMTLLKKAFDTEPDSGDLRVKTQKLWEESLELIQQDFDGKVAWRFSRSEQITTREGATIWSAPVSLSAPVSSACSASRSSASPCSTPPPPSRGRRAPRAAEGTTGGAGRPARPGWCDPAGSSGASGSAP